MAEHEWASTNGDAEDKGRAEGEAKGEAIAKERFLMSLLSDEATASLPDGVLADLVGLTMEHVASMRKSLKR